MNKSYFAAGIMVTILAIWMLSGLIFPSSPDASTDNDADSTTELMKVQVARVNPEMLTRELTLQGQLEPLRHLQIRSGTEGKVQKLHVKKGARVAAGDPLITLAMEGRESLLREAEARVTTAVSEEKAAKKLRKQGLQSQLQLETSQANLATARANLDAIKRDIEDTSITAPFDGVINALPIDIGEQIDKGTMLAEIIDDNTLIASASVAQKNMSQLSVGQSVNAILITGESLPGSITFVSAIADSSTRSFRVEAEIDNQLHTLAAGVSTTLSVPLEDVSATFVSPSTIMLGDQGELGVKAVNENDLVEFYAIKLLRTNSEGAWITGVPEGVRIITLGQGFVNPGEQVQPIEEADKSRAGSALTAS
ncbi:MAG: efflux RND transporter periplasmic adaptor subunit [Granulosicoccus sp.]|nr:efflux RND transporter periplasmic adaptor subunit [Granulosicoccus sp.]